MIRGAGGCRPSALRAPMATPAASDCHCFCCPRGRFHSLGLRAHPLAPQAEHRLRLGWHGGWGKVQALVVAQPLQWASPPPAATPAWKEFGCRTVTGRCCVGCRHVLRHRRFRRMLRGRSGLRVGAQLPPAVALVLVATGTEPRRKRPAWTEGGRPGHPAQPHARCGSAHLRAEELGLVWGRVAGCGCCGLRGTRAAPLWGVGPPAVRCLVAPTFACVGLIGCNLDHQEAALTSRG